MENDSEPTASGNQKTDEPSDAVLPRVQHAEPQPKCHKRSGESKKHPMEWFLESGIFLLLLFTLIATSVAACYTKKQWITADDQEKRDLRAYVLLEPIAAQYPQESPNRVVVSLKVTNKGKTWAKRLFIDKTPVVDDRPLKEPFDVLKVPHPHSEPIVLGPDQSLTLKFGAGSEIPFEQLAVIQGGKKYYDYVALVTYYDVINNPPIQWKTQLSVRLNADTEGPGPGHVSFDYRTTHNCADDDCPKD